MRKRKKTIILFAMITFVGLAQFLKPELFEKLDDHKETVKLTGVPENVSEILEKSCFNCHSSNTELAWFDKITPINFLVASHIKKGTDLLNFSEWNTFPAGKQKALLYYSLNKIRSGEMPLTSYTLAHPASRINGEQIEMISSYLISTSKRKRSDSAQLKVAEIQYNKLLSDKSGKRSYDWVKPALNGITYIPDYRNWKAISTTDRFDNGTLRIIFANETAVEAIKAKKINPFPDGSILAKAAWQQEVAADGNVSAGKFVHVEYMIKDSKKYAKTQGWGWARWKGEDLLPYGKNVNFAAECISCHNPVRKNDNVFTIPLNLN